MARNLERGNREIEGACERVRDSLADIKHDSFPLVFLVSEHKEEQEEENALPWLFAGRRVRGSRVRVVN